MCSLVGALCGRAGQPSCPSGQPQFQGDGRNAVFDQLSVEETTQIYEFLFANVSLDLACKWPSAFFVQGTGNAPGNNCRLPYNSSTWNKANYINALEVIPPAKTETLAYLGGETAHPPGSAWQ